MADDLELLTTPVAKGKSLAKKLRNDMSRESKKTRTSGANGRPYLYPEAGTSQAQYSLGVDEPLPLRVMGVDEPLPHSSTGFDELMPRASSANRRRNRHSYKRTMYGDQADSVELRELNRPARSSMASDAGQFVHRESSLTSKPGQYTKINRNNLQPNRSSQMHSHQQNGEIGNKSVRWSTQESSQFDNSDRFSVTLDRSNESSELSDVSAARSRRYFERYQDTNQERRNPNDPWTVYSSGRDTYFVYGTSLRANNPPLEHPGCCGWWDDMWAPYGGFRRITSPWIFASLSMLFIANILFMTAFLTNYWGVLHVLPNPGQPASQGHVTDHVNTVSQNIKFNDTSYAQWIWNTWKGIPNAVFYDAQDLPEPGLPEAEVLPEVVPEVVEKRGQHVVNRMNTDPKASEYWKFGLWQCCRNTDGLCLGPKFASRWLFLIMHF
jgi:hypothetical protein